MKYRTRSMAEASALLADEAVTTKFVDLEPTEYHNVFNFVIEHFTDEASFHKWTLDYINNEVKVRPKTYDAQLNMLRDRIKLAKG